MAKKPSPIVLTMIICDTVIEDKLTNKKTLVGLFNRITSPKVPCVHPRMNVFLSMTEGIIGEYNGRLICINAEDNGVIFDTSGPVNFADIKEVIEFNFELCGIVFPKYGEYRFEFLCDDELLKSRRFTVTEDK